MLCYSECMGFLKASLLHLAGTHIQAGRRGEMYSARLKDMCVSVDSHPSRASQAQSSSSLLDLSRSQTED